jgi:hypothetical protein
MLSRYFEQPWRIREIRRNCAGVPIDEFAAQLFQQGYSEIAARRHIRSAEHIAHWAAGRGVAIPDFDAPALKRFGDHFGRCRCGRYSRAVPIDVVAGARLFLSHLQGNMEPTIRGHEPALEDPDLLKEFSAWMHSQRGTQDQTLYNYSIPIRALIRHIGEDPAKLSARRTVVRTQAKQSHGVGGGQAMHDSGPVVLAISDRRRALSRESIGCHSCDCPLAPCFLAAISSPRGYRAHD